MHSQFIICCRCNTKAE